MQEVVIEALNNDAVLKLTSKVEDIRRFLSEDVRQNKQAKATLYAIFLKKMIALQNEVIEAVNSKFSEDPQNLLEVYKQAFRQIFGEQPLAEKDDQESTEFLLTIQDYFDSRFEDSKAVRIQALTDRLDINDDLALPLKKKLNENIEVARRKHFLFLELLPDTALTQANEKEKEKGKEKGFEHNFDPLEEYIQTQLFSEATVDFKLIKWYGKLLKNPEKAEKLTLAWGEVIKAYNNLESANSLLAIEFLKKLDLFERELKANFNFKSTADLATCIVAFNEMLRNKGIEQIKDLDNEKKEVLIKLRSQISITSDNPTTITPIIRNITSAVQNALLSDALEANQQSSILDMQLIRVKISNLNWSFNHFVEQAFEKQEHRDQIIIPLAPSLNSDDYSELKDYMINHDNVRDEIVAAKEAIRAEVQQTELRKKQVTSHLSPNKDGKALGELQKLERDLNLPGRLDDVRSCHEDQNAFKHKISKKKYTISEEETALLKRVTGIEVERLILKKKNHRTYPASTLTYEEFRSKIQTEIEAREAYNSTRYFSISKKSVNDLYTAHHYVEFHRVKLTETLFPELRLNPTANKELGELDQDITKVLENTSGIPVKKLVYQKTQGQQYPATTLTYLEYIARIEAEKARIIAYNERLTTRVFPWNKLDYDHLDRALGYMQSLEAHQGNIALAAADSPAQPQSLGPQGRHRDTQQSGKSLRQLITSWVKSITFYSSNKKELHTLNALLIQKTKLAAKLKEMVDPAGNRTKEEKKADRAHKTVSNIHEGKFIESTNLTSNATTSIFTILAVNSEIQSLVKLHLDNKHLKKDLVDKKITAASQAKDCGFRDISVKYKDSDYDEFNSTDVNVLQNNINLLKSELLEPSEESKEGEFQVYINQIGLIIKLAENLEKLLNNKLQDLPIDEYKQVLKMELAVEHKKLVDRCKVAEGFLVTNERALNQIGEMLTEFKQIRTKLKDASVDYLTALDLQLEAKKEVMKKLVDYKHKSPENVKVEIQKEIDHLLLHQMKTYKEVTNISSYSANAKILEIIADLREILGMLSEEGSNIENIIDNYYQPKIIMLQNNKMCETGRVNTLLLSAKDAVHSFTYAADHTTHTITGRHALEL